MPRLKTESEVATLNYLRLHTQVPVPTVYYYDLILMKGNKRVTRERLRDWGSKNTISVRRGQDEMAKE